MLPNTSKMENVSTIQQTVLTLMSQSNDVFYVTLDTILTMQVVRRLFVLLERSHPYMAFSVLMSHPAAIKLVNTILLPEIV